ncbi:MAG: SDR family oxidoreductase, partial [Rhizobiaceae bacterium]
MSKIEGSVVFVTGANRGIGRAFVEELLAAGASKVYAGARNKDSLADLAEYGAGKVIPVELDVTKTKTIEAAAEQANDVTILINNAGIAGYQGLISATDRESARGEMETNFFGTLNMVRSFASALAANGGGAIANISSIAGYVNFPALGSYSASKAAVHSLTQGIRSELSKQGTLVVGVYPGPVDTDLAANVPMDKTSPNEVAKSVLNAIEDGEEDVFPDPVAVQM